MLMKNWISELHDYASTINITESLYLATSGGINKRLPASYLHPAVKHGSPPSLQRILPTQQSDKVTEIPN